MTGQFYDMALYLGKDRQNATLTVTVTHAKVKRFTRRVNRFFCSLDLFEDRHTRPVSCCGGKSRRAYSPNRVTIVILRLPRSVI
jgi:hypothetical protein